MLGLGGFVLVIIVIVVVQILLSSELIRGPGPDKVVVSYLEAIGDSNFDRVVELTCAEYRSDVDSAAQEFNAVSGGAGQDEAAFDFSGVTARGHQYE